VAEYICPNCGKTYQIGEEVCRYCGFVFPFSTVVLSSGRLLQGRYEIQELIHTGGMGYINSGKDTPNINFILTPINATAKSSSLLFALPLLLFLNAGPDWTSRRREQNWCFM
jgi:hypothetical protein